MRCGCSLLFLAVSFIAAGTLQAIQSNGTIDQLQRDEKLLKKYRDAQCAEG